MENILRKVSIVLLFNESWNLIAVKLLQKQITEEKGAVRRLDSWHDYKFLEGKNCVAIF